jgi:hypothetical protein
MKYFTPDLYVRGQSRDPEVVDEVERLWDEAGDRYVAYLDSIRHELPPGLRFIDDHYYLHDARIRGMARQGNAFLITLQLDTPPQSLLTFTFDLLQEPAIQAGLLPPTLSQADAEWLYDEWEKVEGDSPTWSMSILLSNGWEVKLHFRDVSVQEAQAILPVPRTGQMVAPQSA